MQRGYIIAFALAPLAAVFLQGCGKTPAAATEVVTTLTAEAPAGSTVLQVANTVGMVPNSQVTITDPTTGAYETNVISSIGSINLLQATRNAYGVSSTVSMTIAGAGTITSLDQVTTSSGIITDIVPKYATAGTATTIALTGASEAGDLVAFADENVGCNATVPNLAVTITGTAVNSSTISVEIPTAGVYVMCYRSTGKSDATAQTDADVKLTVQSGPYTITAITPTFIPKGTDRDVKLTGTSVEGDAYAWVLHGIVCPAATETKDWTELTKATAGENGKITVNQANVGVYDLCWKKKVGGTIVKQVGFTLTVNAEARCSSYTSCGTGKGLKANAATIKCASTVCKDTDKCCQDLPKCLFNVDLAAKCSCGGKEDCAVGQKCTEATSKCSGGTATSRLYDTAAVPTAEKKPEGSAKAVLMGAGCLLLVSFVVVGIKIKSRTRAVSSTQDDDVPLNQNDEESLE